MEKLVQMNIRAALGRLQAKVANAKFMFRTCVMACEQIAEDIRQIEFERRMREERRERDLSSKFIAWLDKSLESEKPDLDEKSVTQRVAARGVTKPPEQQQQQQQQDLNARYKELRRYILDLDVQVYDSMSDIILFNFRLHAIKRRLKNQKVLIQRRETIEWFFESIHRIEALVNKRADVYDKTQSFTETAMTGLRNVQSTLVQASELDTKSAAYYTHMADELSSDADQTSEASHWWRNYLRRSVIIDYADDPHAWDHGVIGFSSSDIIRNIQMNSGRIVKDVLRLKDSQMLLMAFSRPGSRERIQRQQVMRRMQKSAWRIRYGSDDMSPFVAVLHYMSLRNFYLSESSDSIYWKQLETLYPFYVVRFHFLRLRRSVQRFRWKKWGQINAFQLSASQKENHKTTKTEQTAINGLFTFEKKALTDVKNYNRLFSRFIEFNWTRLKLERLFPELKNRIALEAPAVYPLHSQRAMVRKVVQLYTGQVTLGEGYMVPRDSRAMMPTGTSFAPAAAPMTKKQAKKQRALSKIIKPRIIMTEPPWTSGRKTPLSPKATTAVSPATADADQAAPLSQEGAKKLAKNLKKRRQKKQLRETKRASTQKAADSQSVDKDDSATQEREKVIDNATLLLHSSAKTRRNRHQKEKRRAKRALAGKSNEMHSVAKNGISSESSSDKSSSVKDTEDISNSTSVSGTDNDHGNGKESSVDISTTRSRHSTRLSEKKAAIIHGRGGSADIINSATQTQPGRASFHTRRYIYNPTSTYDSPRSIARDAAREGIARKLATNNGTERFQIRRYAYESHGAYQGVTMNSVEPERPEPVGETRQAAPNEERFWSMKSCTTPTGKPIAVHYCSSLPAADKTCIHLVKEIDEMVASRSEAVIGFDLEWMINATTRAPLTHQISLIQIALPNRVALFHIAAFSPNNRVEHLLPSSFAHIMGRKDVVKVGVAIKADCSRLHRVLGVETEGVLELSYLHRLAKYFGTAEEKTMAHQRRLISLTQQVEEHLGLPLDKDPLVRAGDWSRRLNYRQVQCELC